MGDAPIHTRWLKIVDKTLVSVDGKSISVYELVPDFEDATAFSTWARHFRRHYCLDENIDKFRSGTGKSRTQYLIDYVFPTKTSDFGPATRSGDFAEILLADLLEYQFGYWVPRTRYSRKDIRNESTKGSDVVGFLFENTKTLVASTKDILTTIEAKAQMSGTSPRSRLQDAVLDSVKDKMRLGESLNAMKQRLYDDKLDTEAKKIERFQEGINIPYIRQSGAAAVFCSNVYSKEHVCGTTDCTDHENLENLILIVIHAKELMTIVHNLYERAALEA